MVLMRLDEDKNEEIGRSCPVGGIMRNKRRRKNLLLLLLLLLPLLLLLCPNGMELAMLANGFQQLQLLVLAVTRMHDLFVKNPFAPLAVVLWMGTNRRQTDASSSSL
jgi:hypothetical protein